MNQEKSQKTETQYLNESPKIITLDEIKKENVQNQVKTESKSKEEKRPKPKQKVDYINSLLFLAICLLFLIIITPPILRKLMPKNIITQNNKNESIIILSCIGINTEEQYKINSRTKYINKSIKQNIITYTKIPDEELSDEIKTSPPVNVSANNEIAFFKTIKGLSIDTKQNTIVVSIQDYIANKNTSNFKLMYYFQEQEKQKDFYTSQGYFCKEIKD